MENLNNASKNSISYSRSFRNSNSKALTLISDNDFSRKRPEITKMDLEKMFQESLDLYDKYKRLMHENQIIKNQLESVSNLKEERQNLILSVENVIKEKSKQLKPEIKSSSWLVFKLKKQIHLLKKQIQTKQKIINDFSKNPENEILKEKSIELKCIEDLMLFMPNLGPQKKTSSNTNVNKLNELYDLKAHAKNQNATIDSLENKLDIQIRQCEKISEQIQARQQQLEKIKAEEEQIRKIEESTMTKFLEDKSMNQEKKNSQTSNDNIRDLQVLKNQKYEQVKYLENTIERIKQRQDLEKKRLESEIEKLEKQYKILLESKKTQVEVQKIIPIQKKESVVTSLPKLLVNKVKQIDIINSSKILNFNLAIKKFTHEQWKVSFLKNIQETITIKSLIGILKNYPFQLLDQNEAKLTARYLVQQNIQQKLYYDQNLSQSVSIINSILEKIIGHILKYEKNVQESLVKQISFIINRYQGLIIPALESKAFNQKYINDRDLAEIIDGCMVQLTADHINYIKLYLFSFSLDLNKLEFKRIRDIGSIPLKYKR